MKVSKHVLHGVLWILNLLTFWIKPKKGQITFISMTMEELESDMKCLAEYLQKEGRYSIRTVLIKYRHSPSSSFHYFLNCLHQLLACKQSEVVILNDNNYVISSFKPARLKVVQLWHASGAVKKFGNQIQRHYPIAGYDAVIACSPAWKSVFAQAFSVQEDQVHVTGLPHLDRLASEEFCKQAKEEFFTRYDDLKGKRTILYAPTFRGDVIKGLSLPAVNFDDLFENLKDNEVVLFKNHPLMAAGPCPDKRMLNVSDMDIEVLLSVCSTLITDYSSICFDFALLDKPVVFFAPDYEDYQKDRGLNLNLKRKGGPLFAQNARELADALHVPFRRTRPPMEKFKKQYANYPRKKACANIAALIDQLMAESRQAKR